MKLLSTNIGIGNTAAAVALAAALFSLVGMSVLVM